MSSPKISQRINMSKDNEIKRRRRFVPHPKLIDNSEHFRRIPSHEAQVRVGPNGTLVLDKNFKSEE